MTRDTELAALKSRLQEIDDLHGAAGLLHWDQSTYMPPGGAVSRGRQLALLSRLAHDRQSDPAIGHLLDSLSPWAEAQGADSDAAALIRVTRRDKCPGFECSPETGGWGRESITASSRESASRLNATDEFRDFYAEIVLDDHDFAIGDELVVDKKADGIAGVLGELQD